MHRRTPTMFHAAKDVLASRSARTWANRLLARYGRVQSLKIDSRLKTLEITGLLDGESTPITISIARYALENVGGKKYIRARGFSCTRPWLQSVLNDHGPRQRLELPGWAAAWL
jgi:hypothetical protein